MSDDGYSNYPNWTDEQRGLIAKVVRDEAQKARVAAQFLSLFGPVDRQVVAVPNLLLTVVPGAPAAGARANNRLSVDSSPQTYLTTISVQVPLANHEVFDPDLLAAQVAFRRAAVTIARIEDALLFNGQPAPNLPPVPTFLGGWLAGLPRVYTINGGARQPGLVPAGAAPFVAFPPFPPPAFPPRLNVKVAMPAAWPFAPAVRLANMALWGLGFVNGINDAVGSLEAAGHSGPFACFLSLEAFEAVHTPSPALVLPRDRILPVLGGEYIRRTNAIPGGYGLVIALGGNPVEIVVATDICVRYLQQTAEPTYLFRVAEKISLRVKEWNAIAVLHP
jgi:Encapsulating protein for peroxidase